MIGRNKNLTKKTLIRYGKNLMGMMVVTTLLLGAVMYTPVKVEAASNIIMEEDFESFDEGQIIVNQSAHNYITENVDIYNGSKTGMHTAYIEVDPVTGSNALKYIIGAKDSPLELYVNFEDQSETIKISYDVRIQNHSKSGYYGFCSVRQMDTTSIFAVYQRLMSNQLRVYHSTTSTNYNNISSDVAADFDRDKISVEMIVDVANQTYGIKYIQNGVVEKTYEHTGFFDGSTPTSVNQLRFDLRNMTANNGTMTDGTTDNLGVYWFDNFKIEKVLEDNCVYDVENKILTVNLNQAFENCKVIAASYSSVEEGVYDLCDIAEVGTTLVSGSNDLNLTELDVTNADMIKLFVWDDYVNMTPLTEEFTEELLP